MMHKHNFTRRELRKWPRFILALAILLIAIQMVSACSTPTEEELLVLPEEIGPGLFALIVYGEGEERNLYRGTAAFNPKTYTRDEESAETLLIQLSVPKERALALWLGRSGSHIPTDASYAIADLPNKLDGRISKFIFNDTTFSVAGVQILGHKGFSESGMLTIEQADSENIVFRFNVLIRANGTGETLKIVGLAHAAFDEFAMPAI